MLKQNRSKSVRRLRTCVTYACGVLFLSGCGTWAGNPKDPEPQPAPAALVKLNIRGKAPALALLGGIPVTGTDGTSIGILSLTKALVMFSEIKLKTAFEDEEENSREKFAGPYLIDLLNNRSTPELTSIAVNPGTYSAIEIKLHKTEDSYSGDGAGSPIAGNSIYFSGSYTSTAGSVQSFTMSHEVDEEFNFSQLSANQQGLSVADGNNSLLIAFDLSKWFDFSNSKTSKGVDFTSLTGPIVLAENTSSEVAKNLREVIKENLKSSADFDKDDDSDGELDKDKKTD